MAFATITACTRSIDGAPDLPFVEVGESQELAVSGSQVNSAPIGARAVRVATDTAIRVAIADNPSVTATTGAYVPADSVRYFHLETADDVVAIVSSDPGASAGDLEILTTSLDEAEIDVAYEDSVVVTGGSTPYAWSVSDRVLPPGISLGAATGELTGTPTHVGTFEVTVEVEDNVAATDDKLMNLVVASDPGGAGVPVISMTPSVTTGVAPLAVFFDSSATTAPGIAKPFHHLGYHWDWGDKHSRHRFTTGPVAAHVFSEPGNYIVLHTVIKDDATAVTQAEVITVTDPDTVFSGTNTICFSTDGDFTGAPAGSDPITTNDWDTAISTYAASNKRLLFKRGQTFESSANVNFLDFTGDPIIGAFGTGTNPDVRGIFDNAPIIKAMGDHRILGIRGEGLRIMDLEFTENVGVTSPHVIETHNGRHERILCYRLRTTGFTDVVMYNHSMPETFATDAHDACFMVDCHTTGTRNYPMFGGGERFGLVGNRFEGSETHHVVRITFAIGLVIDSNEILDPNAGDHAIKLHASQTTATYGTFTEKVVIRGNEITANVAWPVSLGPMNAQEDQRVRNVVIEHNRGLLEDGYQTLFHICAVDVTVRCNESITVSGSLSASALATITQRGIEPAPSGCEVYNNTYYNVTGTNDFDYIADVQVHTGDVIVKNNLMHAPNGTAAAKTGAGTSDEAGNLVNPATPGFTDPGTNDFSLTAGSDALGEGVAVPVWHDYLRYTRTTGSVGAHDLLLT